jgi:transcriptional regulator
MYTPDSFRIASTAECHAVMRAHGFAMLVTPVLGGPAAITHLPLMIDATAGEFGTLHGHVARANPHWRQFATGEVSTAVFQGPHGYISPRWYVAKEAVPTWNYVAVHACGRAAIIEKPTMVRRYLEELASRYETGSNSWRLDQLSDSLYHTLSESIVCFSIPIEQLVGKAKLSQNRPAEDRAGVLAGLEALGTPEARSLIESMHSFL